LVQHMGFGNVRPENRSCHSHRDDQYRGD
jgi:hypothetical protein